MNRRTLLSALPFLATAALAGGARALEPPRPEDLDKLIQGTWTAGGEVPGAPGDRDRRPMRWSMEWTFAAGRFRQIGYPPLAAEGSYRPIGAEGGTLILELRDEKGQYADAKEPRRLTVRIVRSGEDLSLVVNGTAFKRKWIEKRG